MEGRGGVEQRASRLVAWAAVLGLPLCAMQPWLTSWRTLGFHDWDVMASHRELVRVSLLRYGELPLWNPYACGGFPGWGYIEGGTTLVSPWLPLYLLLPMAAAIRLEVLGWALVGSVGTYVAAGRLTRDAAARVFVVAMFAVNGRWGLQTAAGHAWHLAYALTPWCLWAYERAVARRSVSAHATLAGLLALLVYAGGIYPLPHTVLALGVYAVGLAAVRRSPRPLGSLAVSGIASIGLAAPKLLPMLHTFAKAPRIIASTEHYDARALWASLVSRQQDFFDRPAHVRPYGWHEWGMYIGAAGVFAIATGIVATFLLRRDRRPRILAALGGMLGVLGLGAFAPWAPWTWVHAHVPFFGSMHVPSRFLYPAVLALALAAAPGLGAIAVLVRRRARRRWVGPLLVAFALGIGIDVALVARKPMSQAMSMVPPDDIAPGRFRHALDPPFAYEKRDWAGPIYLAMLGNVGVLRCYGTPPFERRGAVVATSDAGLVTVDAPAPATPPDHAGERPIATTAIVDWSPNGIVIDVRHAPEGASVVYDMNTDAGWRATVETSSGAVESPAADMHDRVSIGVPAGASRVSFRYHAPGLGAGVAVFAATAAAIALARVRERRRAA